ncbi:MAG: sensor domain-containing diguanylate cyclase [Marivibrio sp.]|uniref:sensor domain-containing diguanylate cyclase n=1 Tax=Marivibrio sp. TaxID=2039719 RepID=UPI0032EB11AF
MSFLSLRARLILLVVLVLVVGFLATNVVSYQVSRERMRESVLETELPLTGDTIYSEIQTDLVRPIFIASLMANDAFLHDWANDGEREADPIVRYLATIKERYDVFTAFFISDATRNYYHFTGVPQVVSAADPEDVWYFRARDMEAPYEINIDPNQAQDNTLTIFINYRVIDAAGRFLGVAGVGLELQAVAELVERYRRVFERTVYFVNDDGLITIHPNPEIAYSRRLSEVEALKGLRAEILNRERGAFQISRDDRPVLMTTRYIPELNWTLVVEADEAEALGDLEGGFLSNFAIGLTAIVLTILAVAVAINRYQRRLERMATTDVLTGLANRQLFDQQLDRAILRARRSGEPLSLVMLDLDRFKALNDRYGHLAGDRVLKQVAALASQCVRRSDVVSRWGGEEFAILMEDCPCEKAVQAAETLRARIAQADFSTALGVPGAESVTASFGVAALDPKRAPLERPDVEDAAVERPAHDTAAAIESLLGGADRALYDAKAAGRNRVKADRAV